MHLYLAITMEEWFHDLLPKEEVCCARTSIAEVLDMMQRYFPISNDHGYNNLPKMHVLMKMQDYIMCLFDSLMNCYGGPGEARIS